MDVSDVGQPLSRRLHVTPFFLLILQLTTYLCKIHIIFLRLNGTGRYQKQKPILQITVGGDYIIHKCIDARKVKTTNKLRHIICKLN